MRCPKCGHSWKRKACVTGGRKGGSAKVSKGFSSPDVLARALATRSANKLLAI